jgi:hypothetical protein
MDTRHASRPKRAGGSGEVDSQRLALKYYSHTTLHTRDANFQRGLQKLEPTATGLGAHLFLEANEYRELIERHAHVTSSKGSPSQIVNCLNALKRTLSKNLENRSSTPVSSQDVASNYYQHKLPESWMKLTILETDPRHQSIRNTSQQITINTSYQLGNGERCVKVSLLVHPAMRQCQQYQSVSLP